MFYGADQHYHGSVNVETHVNHDLFPNVLDADEWPRRLFDRFVVNLMILDTVVIVGDSLLRIPSPVLRTRAQRAIVYRGEAHLRQGKRF